jgi:hypothetical protein
VSFLGAFVVGLLAALATEMLPIHSLRYTPKEQWPQWGRHLAILGAGHRRVPSRGNVAANVGAAWPSIVNGLARATPALRPPDDQVD